MMVGTSKDLWNGVPLPFDLGLIGAPGCNLLQNALVTATITGYPTASWSFLIPNNPVFQCFTFYNQAAIFDLTANGLGFSFSNAQAAVFGN
ncbi:MAG: hypothetical protein ACI91B_002854 [Planctomycetota bacterium]|jgi:hypothetical protein